MNEILGIIDAIEALVMEGKKVPFSDKVIISESQLLILIDKLRIVAKTDPDAIRKAIEIHNQPTPVVHETIAQSKETPQNNGSDVVRAHTEAMRIREDAVRYADNVLAHLQLLVTKMQKNIIKLEQNLESGRTMMDRITDTDTKEPSQ